MPPEDADALRQKLEDAAMEVLVARGLTDASALAEIFGGPATAEARENGRREGPGRREGDRARDGGTGGRRAGERPRGEAHAEEDAASLAADTEPEGPRADGVGEVVQMTDPEEGTAKRPRRRRGSRRDATQQATGEESASAASTESLAPSPSADEGDTSSEAEAGGEATAPSRRRRRSRGGRRAGAAAGEPA